MVLPNYFSQLFVAYWTIILCCSCPTQTANAFVTAPIGSSNRLELESYTILAAAGMGMGMGTKSKAGAKNSKKKNGKNSNGSSNNNSNKKKGAVFDVSASLLRLEKKYDEMMLSSAKSLQSEDQQVDQLAAEMVVAVRTNPSTKSKSAATADWVPVAQLCLRPHAEVSSEWARAAVSFYCRELSHAAALGAKVFTSVPRNDLEYAIEPVESFHKYVYDHVILETHSKNNNKSNNSDNEHQINLEGMTKAQARQILELDENEHDKQAIKKAYRNKSFRLHPDRLREHTAEEVETASVEYAKVQRAYERLTSGVRSAGTSWYASLGGKDRNDFRPIELMQREAASSVLEKFRVESAVVGLDPELVQTFVTRNQAAGASVTPAVSVSIVV